MNGVPLMVVAKNLGHADTRMVEKHYGHLAPSYVADGDLRRSSALCRRVEYGSAAAEPSMAMTPDGGRHHCRGAA
jgi:hypothetical protein